MAPTAAPPVVTAGAPDAGSGELFANSSQLGSSRVFVQQDANWNVTAGERNGDAASFYCTIRVVDTPIQRIGTSYNTQGLVDLTTSYSDSAGTTVVNQVKDVYNGFGQVIDEYQNHSGAVVTSGSAASLFVSYGYDTAAHGSRLLSMADPNLRTIFYTYGTSGSLNDVISRLATITDEVGGGTHTIGATVLEGYKYLSLSTVVELDHRAAFLLRKSHK